MTTNASTDPIDVAIDNILDLHAPMSDDPRVQIAAENVLASKIDADQTEPTGKRGYTVTVIGPGKFFLTDPMGRIGTRIIDLNAPEGVDILERYLEWAFTCGQLDAIRCARATLGGGK